MVQREEVGRGALLACSPQLLFPTPSVKTIDSTTFKKVTHA
jgi:hypothetical protein